MLSFFAFVPDVEEDKHGCYHAADDSNQNVKPVDTGAAAEAKQSHDDVKEGLAQSVVHKVEPDTSALQAALDHYDADAEDKQVKRQNEASESVEVLCYDQAKYRL